MEDFLQILITFSIIIIAAVVNLRKRARDLEEGKDEEVRLPEGWPTMTTTAPQPPTPTKRRKVVRPKPQSSLHPDSQELLTPEISRQRGHQPVVGPKKETSSCNAHDNGASEKGTTAPEGQKHPLTADFDAKKAVIWAEILKPKFDEE